MTQFQRDFLKVFACSLPISGGFSFVFHDFHWATRIGLAIGGATIAGWTIASDLASARNLTRWREESAAQRRAKQAPWDALSAMGREQLAKCRAEEMEENHP